MSLVIQQRDKLAFNVIITEKLTAVQILNYCIIIIVYCH